MEFSFLLFLQTGYAAKDFVAFSQKFPVLALLFRCRLVYGAQRFRIGRMSVYKVLDRLQPNRQGRLFVRMRSDSRAVQCFVPPFQKRFDARRKPACFRPERLYLLELGYCVLAPCDFYQAMLFERLPKRVRMALVHLAQARPERGQTLAER
jgi:hypothetical protein